MRRRKRVAAIAAGLLVVIPAVIIARSGGPPPRRTGAPGDQTCAAAGCHAGTVNPDGGTIGFARLPGTYEPGGDPISFEIELNGTSGVIHGFQATARPNSNSASGQAGRWETAQSNTEVICENGSSRGAGSCPGTSPIEFIRHNLPQSSDTFNVRWIPPASDIGPVTIYAAMNAANGNGNNSGDRIYTGMAELTPMAVGTPPSISGVSQAFDNAGRFSSGTHIQIFGQNLSMTTRAWTASDFDPGIIPGAMAPTALDGVQVTFNGESGFVSFVSPTQVNAVIPDGIGEGATNVKVLNAEGASSDFVITVTSVSPAMQENTAFVSGATKYVVATHNPPASAPVFVGPEGLVAGASFRPAKPGDIITVYVLGAGSNTAYPAGRIPVAAAPITPAPVVRIGEMQADAAAVANPQFVGLAQFNITVPNLPPGDYRITISIDGVDTGQVLHISVMAP